VLDVEASGFGRHSYPIEVGYVLPDGRSFCTLIRPADAWTHWDPSAEAVHHIPREAACRHGRSPKEVATLLNDRLRGLVLYSDGWAHDYAWLGALYEEAGMQPSFKLDSLRALLDDAQAASWHAVAEQVLRERPKDRHRASSDARRLQLTVMRLRGEAASTAEQGSGR
jgi:hypothetical protein